MGRNGFLPRRKPFFQEETPKGYSNLTMQIDIIFSTVKTIQCHTPLTTEKKGVTSCDLNAGAIVSVLSPSNVLVSSHLLDVPFVR